MVHALLHYTNGYRYIAITISNILTIYSYSYVDSYIAIAAAIAVSYWLSSKL